MAYPITTVSLGDWMERIDQRLLTVQSITNQQKTLSLAGTLSMDDIRRYYDFLIASNVFLTEAAAVPGLAAYINTQKGGTVPDAVAEITAIRNAMIATLDWLRTNVPSGTFNSVSYKLAFVFGASNTAASTALVFTAGQTAGYRTQLDLLLATMV